jgi:hypothetical protein
MEHLLSHTCIRMTKDIDCKGSSKAHASSKSNFQCIEDKNAMHKKHMQDLVIDIKNPNESWIWVTSNACFIKHKANVSKVTDLHN